MSGMPALHVRDVPDTVMAALRERAAAHDRSVQQEVRQILQDAAAAKPAHQPVEPIELVFVSSGVQSRWRREDIYSDDTDGNDIEGGSAQGKSHRDDRISRPGDGA